MMNRQTMKGNKVFIYFMIVYYTFKVSAGQTPDFYRNQLHFGYGINYKYNGKLYHNLDRVWVVHRVVIPKVQDLEKIPNFPDEINCTTKTNLPRVIVKEHMAKLVQVICKMAAPHIKVMKQQATYLKRKVRTLVKDDLYHALHSLHPVSQFEYKRQQKRSLPPTPGSLLDNDTLTNTTPRMKLHDIPRNRSKRLLGAIVSAALPAVGKLATLAVEQLGAYLQRKRNRALKVAMQEMDRKVGTARNMMHQLEKDFLLYGEYDVNSTQSIMKLLGSLHNRTSSLEKILELKVPTWALSFISGSQGTAMYSHMTQLYMENIKEKHIRLYETLVTELRLLLRSIAILSKGYLPPHLFPPTTLVQISQQAIAMMKIKNPDYVLALPHIIDYYDMRLVTFGRDDQDRLVICFPIFIKDFNKEPMTLHQIETVKVPIVDTNQKADSYTEVVTTKPYIATNKEYYIQLVLPELVMCKKIRGTFYCEELFLVKHKTQLSCESAIYYNLSREVILENCQFNYYYNITVTPSVLDGGSHIVLANMMNKKKLICSYDQSLARPLPSSSYALVSRDILCNCHIQIGLTYVLKSITSCNETKMPTLEYTVNLAFMNYFHSFWNNGSMATLPLHPTTEEITLPISMEDFTQDPDFIIYGQHMNRDPDTLQELSQLTYQKQIFMTNKKELFNKTKAENENGIAQAPFPKKSKSSFFFTVIFHIYLFIGSSIGILWLIPCIMFAVRQRKIKTLVSAIALHQTKAIEAAAVQISTASLPAEQNATSVLSYPNVLEKFIGMDIPPNQATKLICHDPWVSFVVTAISIIGVIAYLYQTCKNLTILKGHKFASVCHIHLIFCNDTRYIPIKIGQYIGSPFLFKYNLLPPQENITLSKQCLWDTLDIQWTHENITYKDKKIPMRGILSVPLKDKFRLGRMIRNPHRMMYMVKQGDTWYNLTHV